MQESKSEPSLGPAGAQPATEATRACNHAQRRLLPLADTQSFDDARRGFIADIPALAITQPSGAPVWNLKTYGFLAEEEAPDSVHPGLWRHARVNMVTGLFKVCERMYQVRGLDISNMTIIEGDTGLILIDPLISTEVARAALELYFAHRPRREVKAVIYSHSHADHFGGVRGVVDEADVQAGRVQVIAPLGFMEDAISENVTAGNAMARRALYQFGPLLPKGIRGQVDAGLGKTTSSGSVTLIPPTVVISNEVETHCIDGIDCVFELTPGAEAPSEMIIHHPQLRVLNMTEITSHNFHNLLPLRGAQVRDSLAWARYLGRALERYGSHSDILIAQHHWPVWGSDKLKPYLERQRDLYKFVHDQTMRLINHGYTGPEIAEVLTLPNTLQKDWSAHGFYGSLKHNVKAIYQRYLGWYDANPANLDALPPVAAARKAVDYMGGADAVLARAKADFAQGEYRWVAQVCSQVVHAEPDNACARELCANAMEQLGYQAESATWRNAYLQGTLEMRKGPPKMSRAGPASPDVIRALTLDMFFDYLAIRVNCARAEGKHWVMNWHFTDTEQRYVLTLQNSTLTHVAGKESPRADTTVIMSRTTLDEITLQKLSFADAVAANRIQVQGTPGVLMGFLGVLDSFERGFKIVEPRPDITVHLGGLPS
jgi:alkyl sulfatase BDS1-like metallo-beta-lactamase superfamily hydrolase